MDYQRTIKDRLIFQQRLYLPYERERLQQLQRMRDGLIKMIGHYHPEFVAAPGYGLAQLPLHPTSCDDLDLPNHGNSSFISAIISLHGVPGIPAAFSSSASRSHERISAIV